MRWITGKQWQGFAEEGTTAHRVASSTHGWLDRYGEWLLWSGDSAPDGSELRGETQSRYGFSPRGYLARKLAKSAAEQEPAQLADGEAPGEIVVRENGLSYEVEPGGGYSTGLFLDQRVNRRWVRGLAPERMLNLFAYTCSFSVCAAAAGGSTCSVDVSKRALARGRANFEANDISLSGDHRFFADDVTRLVPRLARRGEKFDLIILDPPTFGRAGGQVFRIERQLPWLVSDCFELLEDGGWLLVACNFAKWTSEDLRELCADSLRGQRYSMACGEMPPEISRGAISWKIRRLDGN